MVPITACMAAPSAMRLSTMLDTTPRKTPSNAAYVRISAGEALRLKDCTNARTMPISAAPIPMP